VPRQPSDGERHKREHAPRDQLAAPTRQSEAAPVLHRTAARPRVKYQIVPSTFTELMFHNGSLHEPIWSHLSEQLSLHRNSERLRDTQVARISQAIFRTSIGQDDRQ
jgi:hypothetical protein